MKKFLLIALTAMSTACLQAQRVTDVVDRGIVAVPAGNGNFVSWRMFGEEYYDTKYNLYRNGSKIASNLTVTNFQDSGGSANAKYQVEAVVNGVAQTKSKEVQAWSTTYFDVNVKPVVNRDGKTIGNSTTNGASTSSGYTINDISLADVDGDGISEFIVKRNNSKGNLRQTSNTTDFNLYECYKLDGTRLWWIDLGPNMLAGPDEQWDMIGYDWDRDGKAEVLMRGADNMIIHTASGKVINIGDMNYDNGKAQGLTEREEYTHHGPEYLLYLNGETGEPYGWDGKDNWTPMAYPLPRFEVGEARDVNNQTSAEYAAVWGDQDTGHRSCKHYFGAPYLDGVHASIFLGRGCYTRHKFCALDVDPQTHQLTQRWRWNCYDSRSPWFGNGFHNFQIADVDMDGRDEIMFGSMCIDDTGYGLSTTGLGHGDAQHCGDLDPYRWGLEQFTCQEGSEGNSYWSPTTGEIYYRKSDGGDDGRALAGNFSNDYPGGQGRSVSSGVIGLSSDKIINTNGDAMSGSYANLNNRIFWDGDLLDEILNSAGGEGRPAAIFKWGGSRIWTSDGAVHNNSSKCNPSAQGDILGDWREEVVLRTSNNSAMRIFCTTHPTEYALYTLWHDHEYRNAMCWQSVGYNQPPHPSFFLGELEGITMAPPPLLLRGRTVVNNGSVIATTTDHLLICGYENQTFSVQDGASPYILTVNAPAWVQGTGSQQATSGTPKSPTRNVVEYTTTLTGGAFSGTTRIVKQGEGVLILPAATHKHTGETNVWQGTLQFDGTMESSPVWLNRHTTLISNGGKFLGGLRADYNATIYPGGKDATGSIDVSTLTLGFGSRVVFNAIAMPGVGAESGFVFSQLNAQTLVVDIRDWSFGPKYKTPIFEFRASGDLPAGEYLLGTLGQVEGQLSDILIEGISGKRFSLKHEDGKLYLVLEEMRDAATVAWNGTTANNIWDLAETANFLSNGENAYAAIGDDIIFDDNAATGNVVVKGAVSPNSITFNNDKLAYTITGDSILGGGTITKNGTAKVTINTENRTGATTINGGTLIVNSLANLTGITYGALGNVKQQITINDGATLQVSQPIITDQPFKVSGEVTLNVPTNLTFTLNKGMKGLGSTVTKTGAGTLTLGTQNTFSQLVIKQGGVVDVASNYVDQLPATVEFQGGTLTAANDESNNITNKANFIVPKGKTGTLRGGYRSTYHGSLTGEGTFNVYTGGIRCYFDGDWSEFSGTIKAYKDNRQNKKSYDPIWAFRNANGMPKAKLDVQKDVRVSNEGVNIELGSVSGSGTLIGSGNWILGGNDANFILATEIGVTSARTDPYGQTIAVSPSKLTKRGTGKMTIMTVGKLNAVLTVEEGTMAFNEKSLETFINGSNATTVKEGGRIAGQGKFSSMVLQRGAELKPCGSYANETTPGIIKTTALLNANEGSIVNFIISSNSKYSSLQPQIFTMNGTVRLTLLDSYTPAIGDTFTLWTVANTFKGTPAFDLPALPAGMAWDTEGLAQKTGLLRIVEGEAIDYDVDGDGNVALSDVTAIINAINGMADDAVKARADINRDHVVNIADIIMLLNALKN
ncbi:MAG: autotransporter-associated beta strand repeat-containing protein [Prevotella sp.]|nr:autotransporter-associated beta strand repeat-containing protein [Prevotella sp.]